MREADGGSSVPSPHEVVRTLLDARATRSSLAAWLDARHVDTVALLVYAGGCMVSTALAEVVRRHDLESHLEKDLAEVLAHLLEVNAERNAALLDAATVYATILADTGIRPVALKGVAMLAEGRYAEPGARMASDIDLLVSPEALPDALHALRHAGCLQVGNKYLPGRRTSEQGIELADFRNDPRHAFYHVPAIRHPALGINLELHIGVSAPSLPMGTWLNAAVLRERAPLVPWTARSSVRQEEAPPPMDVPSPLVRLLHNFHHSQIKDRLGALGVSDWRHLLDARRLLEQLDDGTLEASFLDRTNRHDLGAEAELHLWQLREWLGTPSSTIPLTPAGVRRVKRFEATRTNPCRQGLVHYGHFWRRRARDLFSPDQLRRYYGPLPYPIALTKAVRFRVANAWGLVRSGNARRLLSGR